jgi:AAA domain
MSTALAPVTEKTRLLSLLVHGASKVGKSTLTSTAPTPILVIDAEGSWRFIKQAGFNSGRPLRRKAWDGLSEPPRHDGTWDVCVVSTATWSTITTIYQWLTQAEHDFVTIVLDSITEIQRKCKTAIAPGGVIKGYDGWGQLLADMDRVIRGFRDLTLSPGPVRVVICVAETEHREGKWRPYMQGRIATSLPYWVDVNGYMYQDQPIDADGAVGELRACLWIGQTPQFETGERVQGRLPAMLCNPNIEHMLELIYDEPAEPTQPTEPEPNGANTDG